MITSMMLHKSTGVAVNYTSEHECKRKILQALEDFNNQFENISKRHQALFQITWGGVGGSYANATPRFGLWPNDISFEKANSLQTSSRIYPSDIDVVLKIKNSSGDTLFNPPIHIEQEIRTLFKKIYTQYRILFSWSPGIDMPNTITIDELSKRL